MVEQIPSRERMNHIDYNVVTIDGPDAAGKDSIAEAVVLRLEVLGYKAKIVDMAHFESDQPSRRFESEWLREKKARLAELFVRILGIADNGHKIKRVDHLYSLSAKHAYSDQIEHYEGFVVIPSSDIGYLAFSLRRRYEKSDPQYEEIYRKRLELIKKGALYNGHHPGTRVLLEVPSRDRQARLSAREAIGNLGVHDPVGYKAVRTQDQAAWDAWGDIELEYAETPVDIVRFRNDNPSQDGAVDGHVGVVAQSIVDMLIEKNKDKLDDYRALGAA